MPNPIIQFVNNKGGTLNVLSETSVLIKHFGKA